MVGSVEELVGEVEGVLLIGAGHFDLRSDGIECDVAGDDIVNSPLLTTGGLQEPAAYLHVLRGSSGVVVNIKLADGLVLLTSELTKDSLLVGVDVGQLIVWLLHEVDYIGERGFT